MSCDHTPTSPRKFKLGNKPINNQEPDPVSVEIPSSLKKREDPYKIDID
jgi:hypothetical protein